MQPSAKRRAGNQIGKDNDDDEVEGVDPGTWQSDPDQISRRRKVKARRAGDMPEGGASVPSSYNPFSEISLAAPSLNLNQIAETNLLPSAEGSLELYPHPCFRPGHQEQCFKAVVMVIFWLMQLPQKAT